MEQQIRPFWMARMANDTDGASFRMSLVVAFTHLGLTPVDDSIKPIGVPQIVKQMGVIISSSVKIIDLRRATDHPPWYSNPIAT